MSTPASSDANAHDTILGPIRMKDSDQHDSTDSRADRVEHERRVSLAPEAPITHRTIHSLHRTAFRPSNLPAMLAMCHGRLSSFPPTAPPDVVSDATVNAAGADRLPDGGGGCAAPFPSSTAEKTCRR